MKLTSKHDHGLLPKTSISVKLKHSELTFNTKKIKDLIFVSSRHKTEQSILFPIRLLEKTSFLIRLS